MIRPTFSFLIIFLFFVFVVVAQPLDVASSNITVDTTNVSTNGTSCLESKVCNIWSSLVDCNNPQYRNCTVYNVSGVCGFNSSIIENKSNSCPIISNSGGGGYNSYKAKNVTQNYTIVNSKDWSCSLWTACVDGRRTRTCNTTLKTYSESDIPLLEKECSVIVVDKLVEVVLDFCSNNILDVGESDVDCGGDCEPCPEPEPPELIIDGESIPWTKYAFWGLFIIIVIGSIYSFFKKDKREELPLNESDNELLQEEVKDDKEDNINT